MRFGARVSLYIRLRRAERDLACSPDDAELKNKVHRLCNHLAIILNGIELAEMRSRRGVTEPVPGNKENRERGDQ